MVRQAHHKYFESLSERQILLRLRRSGTGHAVVEIASPAFGGLAMTAGKTIWRRGRDLNSR